MKHVLSVAIRALVPTVVAPVMALALAAPSHAAEPVYGPSAPDPVVSGTLADALTDTTLDSLITSPLDATSPDDLGFGEAAAAAAESLLSISPVPTLDAASLLDDTLTHKPGKKGGKKGGKDKGKKGSKHGSKNGGKDKGKKGGKKHQPAHPPKPQPQTGGLAERAVGIAAAQIGDPYVYGAAGPNAFDCSGLTSFAYGAAGRGIPRTSSAQRGALRTIPASARQRGDLVFFHGSSGVYHVGIYIGDNTIIHAPGTGSSVQRAAIWTSSVSYGRP